MATVFEPRSSFRSSQSGYQQGSMADTLPSIEFGFDDLRKRMAAFTVRFDDCIAEGRKQVLAERHAHRARLAELQEDKQLKQRSISILQQASASHSANLAKEAAETAEMNAAISQLSASRDAHAQHNSHLQSQITSTRTAINQRLAAQQEYAERLSAQMAQNAPELAFYEDYLGLRIESPADDEIAFVFSCVDDRDPDKECEIVLDLSRRDYAVKECRPRLEDENISAVVDRLNEGRDLAPFLKDMRRLFQRKCKEGRS